MRIIFSIIALSSITVFILLYYPRPQTLILNAEHSTDFFMFTNDRLASGYNYAGNFYTFRNLVAIKKNHIYMGVWVNQDNTTQIIDLYEHVERADLIPENP